MTAASVAALTVYDMVKGVERGVEVRAVRLLSKSGGKSGDWHRPADRRDEAPRPRRRPGERMAGRIGKRKRPGEPAGGPAHDPRSSLTVSDRRRRGHPRRRVGRRRWPRASPSWASRSQRQVVPGRACRAIAAAHLDGAAAHPLVVTTGGTGLTPRDVTPQATATVLDYEVPGIAEAMRAEGRASTPFAALSRGLVGVARPGARRQRAGLAQGVAGVARGGRPRPRPRARDARRPIRPRRCPRRRAARPAAGRLRRTPDPCSSRSPTFRPTRSSSRSSGARSRSSLLVVMRHLRVWVAVATGRAALTRACRRRPAGVRPLRDPPDADVPRARVGRDALRPLPGLDDPAHRQHRTSSPAASSEAVLGCPLDGALWAVLIGHPERRGGRRPGRDRRTPSTGGSSSGRRA